MVQCKTIVMRGYDPDQIKSHLDLKPKFVNIGAVVKIATIAMIKMWYSNYK